MSNQVSPRFSRINQYLLGHTLLKLHCIWSTCLVICPIVAWLAQLGERRSVEREVNGFEPRPNQHSGSLNNWEESAAFVICKRLDFLVFSDKDGKP